LRSIAPSERDARYSPVAICLHWAMTVMIVLGWVLPRVEMLLPRGSAPVVIGLHRSLGVTVLALVLVRALWRFVSPPPGLPAGTTQVVRWTSHAVHAALYLLMLAIPILGMLMTWSTGRSVSFWGLIHVGAPAWLHANDLDLLRTLHAWTANLLAALVGVHVAAALIHHYVFRDGLIDRILPGRMRAPQGRNALI
jgi:cytochrome b561